MSIHTSFGIISMTKAIWTNFNINASLLRYLGVTRVSTTITCVFPYDEPQGSTGNMSASSTAFWSPPACHDSRSNGPLPCHEWLDESIVTAQGILPTLSTTCLGDLLVPRHSNFNDTSHMTVIHKLSDNHLPSAAITMLHTQHGVDPSATALPLQATANKANFPYPFSSSTSTERAIAEI